MGGGNHVWLKHLRTFCVVLIKSAFCLTSCVFGSCFRMLAVRVVCCFLTSLLQTYFVQHAGQKTKPSIKDLVLKSNRQNSVHSLLLLFFFLFSFSPVYFEFTNGFSCLAISSVHSFCFCLMSSDAKSILWTSLAISKTGFI